MKSILAALPLAVLLLALPLPAEARPHHHKAKATAAGDDDNARTGTGEADYDAAADAMPAPLPSRTVAPPPVPSAVPPVPVQDDGYSERNFTYVPPGQTNEQPSPAAPPAARSAVRETAEIEPLQAGQSFGGQAMATPAAPYETGIALDQQGLADLFKRIGQPAPAGKLPKGMGAVFASSGPQSYSGHGVALRTLNEDRDSGPLLVEVTFIQPSPRVAVARADGCPWQILIVPASDIKLLARRSYAGVPAR